MKKHFLCFDLILNILEFLLFQNLSVLNTIIFIWWILLIIILHELWNIRMFILEVSIHLPVLGSTNICWILCCLQLLITLINMILKVLFILLIFNNCWSVDVVFLIKLECNYFFIACSMLGWADTFLCCKVTHFFSWNCSFAFWGRSTIHATSLSFHIWFTTRRWFVIWNSTVFFRLLIFCLRTVIKLYLLANTWKLFWRKFLL